MTTGIVSITIQILTNCCHFLAAMTTGIVNATVRILTNCSHLPEMWLRALWVLQYGYWQTVVICLQILLQALWVLQYRYWQTVVIFLQILLQALWVLQYGYWQTVVIFLQIALQTLWVLQYRRCQTAVSCLQRCVQTFWKLSADSTLFPYSWRHDCRYFEWQQEMLYWNSGLADCWLMILVLFLHCCIEKCEIPSCLVFFRIQQCRNTDTVAARLQIWLSCYIQPAAEHDVVK